MQPLMGRAENELDRLYEKLEDETTKFGVIAQDAAEARSEFKLAWATAFLHAEGAMDLRRVEADSKSYKYLHRKELAEALEKSQRAVLESIREQMGACRTVMASSRI